MQEHNGLAGPWWLLPTVTTLGAGVLVGALVTGTRPTLAGAALWVLGFVAGCVLLDEFVQRARRRVRYWQVRRMVQEVSRDRAALLRALNRPHETRRTGGQARRAD